VRCRLAGAGAGGGDEYRRIAGGICRKRCATLQKQGFRAKADLRNEKITYKIREHSLQKIPYLLVVGDKERDANQVAVRARGNVDLGVMPVSAFVERLQQDVSSKA
jgi:threonyl-tRNA synthetase